MEASDSVLEERVEMMPPIRIISTTYGFSSLEAPFLNALLQIERVRRHLGVQKNVDWRFISTATLEKPEVNSEDSAMIRSQLRQEGIIAFNVGGAKHLGEWDQHGRAENQGLCEMCSLDLVRGNYDFLTHRPWLTSIYAAVRQNDIYGTKLCPEPRNIRLLMNGLATCYPASTQENCRLILDTMSMAFWGVFQRSQAGFPADQAFRLDQLLEGVKAHYADEPERIRLFIDLVAKAEQAMDQDWEEAVQAVSKAEAFKKGRTVDHPLIKQMVDRQVRLIEVQSDSLKAAPATRTSNRVDGNGKSFKRPPYDLSIVCRQNGHVQISSGTLFQYGKNDQGKNGIIGKWRFDLSHIAMKLRILEAKFADKRLERGNFTASGFVFYANGQACPWYLPEFRTSLLNGSLSSPDVPPTKIDHNKILDLVARELPSSSLLRADEQGNWCHVAFDEEGQWHYTA
ncbi:hypothetical protein HYZ76_02275 [Candidatus Falkowbacteria bacterium]|nr:hypothetical protein [Candidatus Falkowbacteria bacterium]